jgi:acyl-coenzyme A thioesterase PaaI-like protein
MESIVGIFNSLADAKRAAAMLQTLGIAENRITVLSPHTPETEIEAQIPTTDTEQPGMGQAMGGTVGAALGAAGGAAAASFLVPGVGPVLAFGIIGAALCRGRRCSCRRYGRRRTGKSDGGWLAAR